MVSPVCLARGCIEVSRKDLVVLEQEEMEKEKQKTLILQLMF